jgi:hypothetical protein
MKDSVDFFSNIIENTPWRLQFVKSGLLWVPNDHTWSTHLVGRQGTPDNP